MKSNSSSTAPTVLLDTSVISGFVKQEMKPDDATAFSRIAEMARKGQLTIFGSTVTKEELDRIPSTYRSSHLEEYGTLQKIRASNATWVDTNPGSTSFGTVVQHPDYQALRSILKDENDARLAFQGKMAGVTTFLTIDYRSILNKSTLLASHGVYAVSPSQYFSSTAKSS